MKITLFLGAGFSVPFGLPTMNDFKTHVQDSSDLSDDEKYFVNTLFQKARSAASFLDSSPNNLEDILSLAVMEDRLDIVNEENALRRSGLIALGNEENVLTKEIDLGNEENVLRGDRIKRILWKVCRKPSSIDRYWDRFKSLEGFIGCQLPTQDHELTFITTNYDINIESALFRCGMRAESPPYSTPIKDKNTLDNLYRDQGTKLYKLHGSVNWFEGDETETIIVDDRIVNIFTDKGSGLTLPYVCTANYPTNTNPIIIPPSYLKPEFVLPMKYMWQGAAHAIAQAEILVFVGYSFPQTDTEMKYFLASSLVENIDLRKIIIVDPKANSIVERLKNNESGYGSHFKDFLHPLQEGWTNVRISKEL